MVKIVGFKERLSNEGKPFMALILQGGVEIIHSANGGMYATARKASVATTFNAETCQALIGTDLAGSIEKQVCEPYNFTVQQTGEVLVLHHRYVFVPETKQMIAPMEIVQEIEFPELAGMNIPAAAV